MKALIKKEFSYYLNTPVGYIVAIIFAAFSNFLFVKDIFAVGSASMRPFFGLIPWLFVVFIPAITMRSFAEEKRLNTIETILTLPLSEFQIVLAKYISLVLFAAIGVALTLSLPISLSILSQLSPLEIIVSYFGVILTASAFISCGLFFSSLTKNQMVAFLSSAIVLFIFVVLSLDFFSTILPKIIQDYLVYFSPAYHLQNFTKGVIDARSVFYFVSFSALFLLLTVIHLEKRD